MITFLKVPCKSSASNPLKSELGMGKFLAKCLMSYPDIHTRAYNSSNTGLESHHQNVVIPQLPWLRKTACLIPWSKTPLAFQQVVEITASAL